MNLISPFRPQSGLAGLRSTLRSAVLRSTLRSAVLRSTLRSAVLKSTLGPAAVATALLVAAPAQAAPQWLSPQVLSAPGQDRSPHQVAFDPGDDAVVAWQASGAHSTIVSAARPAGGVFSAPQTLSDPNFNSTRPDVASDSQGDAIAVWLQFDGANERVQAAYRPAGGPFGAPQTLSPVGYDAATPHVAMDGNGDASVVWSVTSGASSAIQAAQVAPGGVFQAPVYVCGFTTIASLPQVALDVHGNTLVVWDGSDGANIRIEDALRSAGGSFEAPQLLSPAGYNADTPQVAFDASGDALAVWRFDGPPASTVQGSYRPAGGGFAAAQTISSVSSSPAQVPQVAFDGHSEGVVVWQQSDGTDLRIYASVRSPSAGGAFSAPSTLDPGGQEALEPRIAGDGSSATVVSWKTFNGITASTQAAVRPAGGDFAPATSVSATGPQEGTPAVGVDGQGNGIAVWSRANGANYLLEAAGYDGAGPLLRGLTLPTMGVVGQPLQFFVAPLDVWSPVLSESFAFGDGASSSSVAAAHAYAAPGSYRVTVTASDVLGNVTSVTQTVTIEPPPGAPSGGTAGAPAGCTLAATRTQRLLSRARITLEATCSAALRATLGGHLTVRAPGILRARRHGAIHGWRLYSYALHGVRVGLASGRTELRLALAARSLRSVLVALGHHRQVGLYLTLLGTGTPAVHAQLHLDGIAPPHVRPTRRVA